MSVLEIGASVERTLLQEARRNELKLAYVRVVALALTTVLNSIAHMYPAMIKLLHYSLANALVSAFWFLVSVLLVIVLHRGWYRPWLRTGAPFLDGFLILSLNVLTTSQLNVGVQDDGWLVNMAAVCCLLAVSGALRLSATSSVLTTVLALAIFINAAHSANYTVVRAGFPCAIIVAAGLLSVWMAGIVHRATESAVGRSMLARFLPPELVEGAHKDPMALLATPRSVEATVLISDLRGFTAMAETMDPAGVLSFLSEVQGRLARVVREHGGTVDKFMGDGMLAVFGAPAPLPDHAARALAAAEGMVHAVADLGVGIGVGIHSGPVVAGCLGSGARLEFTVIGDTVNTASRLEALTKEAHATILASEETARRAGALERLRRVGDFPIRGKREALAVFALDVRPAGAS